MKQTELLRTLHSVQLNWLHNQIAKIAHTGGKSFHNIDVAERAYNRLNDALLIDDPDLEHFMSVHLSPTGKKKLVTTLRVYIKRNNTERLQVEITESNKERLDKMVNLSGRYKTKIDIINYLIATADLSDFEPQ